MTSINMRWFATTHTLQILSMQVDPVEQKLSQNITNEQEDTEVDDEIQNLRRHFVETIAANANESTDAQLPIVVEL